MSLEDAVAMHTRLASATALLAATLAGCMAFDTPDDYNRHRLTDLTLPRERSDLFYFDATVTSEFPGDSAAAEAQRLRWLDEWLKLRQMCPDGHEVLQRRGFGDLEDNVAHRDLRYEVRCKAASASDPQGRGQAR